MAIASDDIAGLPNPSLLERLEITHKRVQIRVAQLHGWHERAGFDGVGVLYPQAKVFPRVFGRAGRDRATAYQVRQIATDAPRCSGAADRMAVYARGCFENAYAGDFLLILIRG